MVVNGAVIAATEPMVKVAVPELIAVKDVYALADIPPITTLAVALSWIIRVVAVASVILVMVVKPEPEKDKFVSAVKFVGLPTLLPESAVIVDAVVLVSLFTIESAVAAALI